MSERVQVGDSGWNSLIWSDAVFDVGLFKGLEGLYYCK